MKNTKMKCRNLAEPRDAGLKLFFICGLGLCLCLCLAGLVAPIKCLAQDNAKASILPIADVTLFPLSNTAIATVKGTGLLGPSLKRSSAPTGTIILWDELKPLAQQQNVLSGTQVITINGVTQ